MKPNTWKSNNYMIFFLEKNFYLIILKQICFSFDSEELGQHHKYLNKNYFAVSYPALFFGSSTT